MNGMSATFQREIGALPAVFELVGHFFETERVDPEFRFLADFVLEEIFTNFVKYNPTGKGGIETRLAVENDQMVLALTDFDSAPFDIHKDAPEADTTRPLQERTPGRLGVHLVKKMVDRLEYAHENRVTTITLYKNLR
jgi:serine/threonine-protein kinase RsbW